MQPSHWTPARIQTLADQLGSKEKLAVALAEITGHCSFYTVNRWTKGLFSPDKRNAKALDEVEARRDPGP